MDKLFELQITNFEDIHISSVITKRLSANKFVFHIPLILIKGNDNLHYRSGGKFYLTNEKLESKGIKLSIIRL